MRIVVNWAQCEGNGNCEAVAPELFALNDEDELTILNENPSEDLRKKAEAAAGACPKSAITIED